MKPQRLLKCSYHLKAAWGRRIRVKNVTSGDLTILQDKPNSSRTWAIQIEVNVHK